MRAGSFRYNLFLRTLQLENVELAAEGREPAFVKAARVSVSWQYRDVSNGLNAITDIRADDVNIDIRRLRDGTWNLPQAGENSAPIRGLPSHAQIQRMSFRYDDGQTTLSLPSVNAELADGKWHADLKTPGEINNPKGSAKIDGLHVDGALNRLDFPGLSARGNLSLREIHVASEPQMTARTSFSFDGSAMRFDLQSTHAESSRGRLDGEASLSLRTEVSTARAVTEYESIHSSIDAFWPGLEFDAFRATALVESRRKDVQGRAQLRITKDQMTAAVLSVKAAGATAQGNLRIRFPSLQLSGTLTGGIPSLADAVGNPLIGSAAFSADLAGTAKDPQVGLNLTTTDAGIGPIRDARLTIDATYGSRRIQINDALLDWNGQEASAAGTIDLHGKDAALDLHVTADDWSVERTATLFNPDLPVGGKLNLLAKVGGTVSKPETIVQLEGEDLIAWGEHFGHLQTQLETSRQLVRVLQARVEKPQATGPAQVNARGWVDLEARTYSGELETRNLHFETFRPFDREIHAAIDLKASGEGSLDDPRGDVSVKIDSPELGTLQAAAALSQQDLNLTNVSGTLRSDPFGISASTSFVMQGRVPWTKPQAAEIDATLSAATATVAEHKIDADGTIQLHLHNEILTLEKGSFVSEEAKFSLGGSLPLSQPMPSEQLTVEGQLPLALAIRHLPEDLRIRLQGIASIQGSIRGTVMDPAPDLEVSVADASLSSDQFKPTLNAIAARARVNSDRIDVEQLQAKLGEGTIRGRASIPLTPGEAHVSLDVQKLDVAAISLPDSKLKSSITAHIEGSSPSSNFQDATASVRFSELSLSTPNTSLAQSEETLLSFGKGQLRLDNVKLKNPLGSFQAAGTVDLIGKQSLNLQVDGKIETDILSRTSTAYGLSGPMEAHVAVTGAISDPQFRGAAEMKGGRLVLANPFTVAGDQIDLRLAFEGRTIRIERASGSVNGGTITGGGAVTLERGTIGTADLKLNGDSVFLNYPKGLQSASNFDLTLKNQGRSLLVGGKITILDGSYRDGFSVAGVAATKLRQVSMVDSQPNELVSRLRFDVALDTDQPVVLDNNIARVNLDADLRLIGTPIRPVVTGRFEMEEGGRIYFAGRTFQVVNGVIDFTDESRIAPRFNLEAAATINEYEVTLKLTGDMDKPETAFTAEPSLNEDQILALIYTGSTDTTGKNYAQTQMITLFGSGMTSGLTTRLRNTVGLSEFRIDPALVSADKDPTARLTIGQSFTPEFRITYSTNLTNSQDQIWTAEYDWRRRFLARFFRETNQSNRMELRQKFRFGGGSLTGEGSRRQARSKYRIGNIVIQGNPIFDEKTILKKLKLKPGKKYDFLKAQQGLERLKAYYAKNGYAEVRIHQNRETKNGTMEMTFDIDAGKPVKFVFEGASASSRLRRDVARTWQQGIIDPQRLGTTSQIVQRHFVREGYADVSVENSIRDLDQSRTVLFEIVRGQDYGRPQLSFPGTNKAVAEDLELHLKRSKLDMEVKTNPKGVIDAVSAHLRNQGYLAVQVSQPEVSTSGNHLLAAIPIMPGPEFTIGTIQFHGAHELKEDQLARAMVVEPGDKYVPDDRYTLAQRVQQAYWNAGFRNAQVEMEEKLDPAGKTNLVLNIDEGQRFTIASVQVQGISETTEQYIRKRMTLTEGDVLSAKEINQSRKNLLDSGAYNILDFTYPAAGPPAAGGLSQPVDLMIKVREPKPFRIDAGGTYDTDRGPGGIADISTVNTLGEARTLGFRTTADRLKQDYRIYFNQPFFGRRKITTTSTLFSTHEVQEPFTTLEVGATIQQNIRFRERWNLSYGYQFEYVTLELQDVGRLFKGTTSSMISSLAYDSRDAVLDATKGTFVSGAVEYGPPNMGGSVDYYRVFVQASKYFGLSKPNLMPFEGEKRRSRFVFATSARVGIADAISGACILLAGTCIVPVDRFYAGGGTTIRGYSQNSVGPKAPDGDPIGGQATLIFNNEFRFPLYKILDGVAFVDTGNVWAVPSSFNIKDLRTGAGFGIRVRNPFVIIRFDYGWKVGRRPGESAGAFFFSIGQAF